MLLCHTLLTTHQDILMMSFNVIKTMYKNVIKNITKASFLQCLNDAIDVKRHRKILKRHERSVTLHRHFTIILSHFWSFFLSGYDQFSMSK